MAQYHLRVADSQLHVRFNSGEESSVPLDEVATSHTLSTIVSDLGNDGKVSVSFPEGLLEVWLQRAATQSEDMGFLSTQTLVEYMKVCCIIQRPFSAVCIYQTCWYRTASVVTTTV